ncbi:hypothetical protein BDR04DRAFT_1163813 [Suillus decipiens]|nr:hypothetical protein BDR04DRAFT_1163813 [Suillus decipiens]
MSDSVVVHWISKYIIDVAETYGNSITDLPIKAIPSEQKKSVQILQFLTYNHNLAIWAKVSDEEYTIPICFTQEAVSKYVKNSQGRRLTEVKHAVLFIGQFRLIFVRIPVGNNRVRLSPKFHIALEAGVIEYVGSALSVLGSPQDVETNIEVNAWVRELRRDSHDEDIVSVGHHKDTLFMAHKEENKQPSEQITLGHPIRMLHVKKDIRSELMMTRQTLVDGQVPMRPLTTREGIHPESLGVVTRSPISTPPHTHTVEKYMQKNTTPETSEWPSSASKREAMARRSLDDDQVGELSTSNVMEGTSAIDNGFLHQISKTSSTSAHSIPPPAQCVTRPAPYASEPHASPMHPVPENRNQTARSASRLNSNSTMHSVSSRESGCIRTATSKGAFYRVSPLAIVCGRRKTTSADRARGQEDLTSGDRTTKTIKINARAASGKKRRTRLMGYKVDFENMRNTDSSIGPFMNMGRLRAVMLRTGRIRTLGDEVTRDGSIYIMSD